MKFTQSLAAKAVEHLPGVAQSALKPIPEKVLHATIATTFNTVFKQHIRNGKLNFVQHKRVGIGIPDLEIAFSVSLINGRLQVATASQQDHVNVKAKSTDLLLLATGKVDPDTLFFRRRLLISGDTELGLELKNFLDTLELSELLPRHLYQAVDRLAEAAYTPAV